MYCTVNQYYTLSKDRRIAMNKILEKLQGGDLRSIGMVDEVVKDILADSTLNEYT